MLNVNSMYTLIYMQHDTMLEKAMVSYLHKLTFSHQWTDIDSDKLKRSFEACMETCSLIASHATK